MDDGQRLAFRIFPGPEFLNCCFTVFLLCFPGLRGRIPVAHLLHGGLFHSVSEDDAVAAESVVALAVTEIAAVAQHFLPLGIFVIQGLVHVVPDEAALVLRIFFFQADVAFHSSQRISHIMHIFT